MDKLELLPTEKVEALARKLVEHAPQVFEYDGRVYMRKSAGDFPQYIYVIGSVYEWIFATSFAALLVGFFSRVGGKTADAFLEWLKKDPEKHQKLISTSSAFSIIKDAPEDFDLIIKFNGDNLNGRSINFWINEKTQKDISFEIGVFNYNHEKIFDAIKENESVLGRSSQIDVTVEKDIILIKSFSGGGDVEVRLHTGLEG